MVQLLSVMLRLHDTLHDFRSVTMVCSRGSLGVNLSSPQKIAGKIVSVQRLELRPRRSKGIRYIFSNIQDSCLLQGHMAGFK